ncbi:MAG: DUF4301 family protein [Bacteroidales bacterium]
MYSPQDLDQINSKSIDLEHLNKQIAYFISGFPYIRLKRPATAGDGILVFNEEQINTLTAFFDKELPSLKVVKFVPASGAASRMFKNLFEFREQYTVDNAGEALFLKDRSFNSTFYFINHLSEIAFFNDLAAIILKSGQTIDQVLKAGQYATIIDKILGNEGLNYSNLPKALLKFHSYPEGSRTAAEEHLVEAAAYTRDLDNNARIHFTISAEHREKFLELFTEVKSRYESGFDVKYDITFSIQKPSTDIIAVDESNQPFREQNGSLLFRPGGHGALLENLNDINADLIFVKNIDNIVPDHLKSTTYQYKKLLGGYLLTLKETISDYLQKLDGSDLSPAQIDEMIHFAQEKLFLDIPEDLHLSPVPEITRFLHHLFNRPLRVCGMVKNEGEPGGGPFWVTDEAGKLSLQIVESSQINLSDPGQKSIVDRATHFNPVDLVCSTRDYQGVPFNLPDFVDENTGFISMKSSGGKILKAQELPGLWNGAMAKWITLFVEVPIITFNPVKTVNDLLRKEHISK